MHYLIAILALWIVWFFYELWNSPTEEELWPNDRYINDIDDVT